MFETKDRQTHFFVLEWKHVPYIVELRKWWYENFDPNLTSKENQDSLMKVAEELCETGTKPKHPVKRILDTVTEWIHGEEKKK